MEWFIVAVLGLSVGGIFSLVYLELTKTKKEKSTSLGDFMNYTNRDSDPYNKSADHYRDGDNT